MEGLVEESEEQISIIINKSDNNKLFIGIYTIPDPKVKDKVQISMSDRFATAAKCSNLCCCAVFASAMQLQPERIVPQQLAPARACNAPSTTYPAMQP